MKCPNCGREMINKSYSKLEAFYHWEDEEYYYRNNYYEKFVCNNCKISFEDDKWHIPINLMPTEKQKKTILFINNHLGMDLKAPTKQQCWLDIDKYFDKAKRTPLYSYENWFDEYSYEYWLDMNECF